MHDEHSKLVFFGGTFKTSCLHELAPTPFASSSLQKAYIKQMCGPITFAQLSSQWLLHLPKFKISHIVKTFKEFRGVVEGALAKA
jgi:hypothetical protein